MKKIASTLLVLLLLATLAPPGAIAAPLSVSDDGVELVKQMEGYRQYAYESGGSWYIGYGVSCKADDYPNGVTEAEAEGLLRVSLAASANRVNNFLRNYNITLNQAQFDAVVSFTFNLGSQWIGASRFSDYLVAGEYTQHDMVSAMAAWCAVGGEISRGLISRRMVEAYVFVTGDYRGTYEGQYAYLRHLAGEGTVEHRLLFFPIGQPYGQLQTPTCGGKVFLGWYTAEGEEVTGETLATGDLEVTAKWAELSDITDWENPYPDLPDDHWSFPYVRDLSLLRIIEGYEDGTFQPGRDLRAGEALKLILLAAGHPERGATGRHWASGYLDYALEREWLKEGQITDLNAPITRALVAQIAAQALDLPEVVVSTPFADADDPCITALYSAEIVQGDTISGQRYYFPNNNLRRAEACAIVWRMERFDPKKVFTPDELGYISYADRELPLLEDVPVCTRDPELYTLDEQKWITYGDETVQTSLGVDVSYYQGDIDWKAVKRAGVEFAFIRLGYRGYTQGTINLDSKFYQNIDKARAAGLKVGVYFFSTALTPEEAREEAAFVLEKLEGRELEMPLVYDWEANSKEYRNYDLDTALLNRCAVAFCEAVEAAGYQPMVYFNLPTAYLRYDLSGLTAYDFWFAQYSEKPTMYYDYHIWQYTDSGKVDGIDGRVDMNIAFKAY